MRERLEFSQLKRRIHGLYKAHGANMVVIEEQNIGIALITELRRENINVLPYKPKMEKQARLASQGAKIEAGKLYVPKDAPWLAEFIRELLTFPNGKHDDQVDALTQMLEHVQMPTGLWII